MKRHALVVDENDGTRSFLCWVLDEQGWDVTTAVSLPEASATLAQRNDFHVIITNVLIPGGTGLDLLELARERAPGAMRVLLASPPPGVAMRPTAEAHQVLTKPITSLQLQELVSRIGLASA